MYPKSVDTVMVALRGYQIVNFAVLAVGLTLLLQGLRSPAEVMLVREEDLVQVGFLMAQLAAFLIAPALFCPYYSLHRSTEVPATRTASLQPRRLFDFVSPGLLALAVIVNVAFVGLILYVRQFDYPWFGGYANLAIVGFMNLFFASVIFKLLYGKRQDPWATDADRDSGIKYATRVLLFTSTAMIVFTGLTIALQAFNLGALKPSAMSLYIQLMAAALHGLRIGGVNFEVYKDDELPAWGSSVDA